VNLPPSLLDSHRLRSTTVYHPDSRSRYQPVSPSVIARRVCRDADRAARLRTLISMFAGAEAAASAEAFGRRVRCKRGPFSHNLLHGAARWYRDAGRDVSGLADPKRYVAVALSDGGRDCLDLVHRKPPRNRQTATKGARPAGEPRRQKTPPLRVICIEAFN
jgi:hypothetical protein